MPTIDSLRFDTTGWKFFDRSPKVIRWRNQIPDELSLNFFPIKPDIPINLSEVAEVEKSYREIVQSSGGRLAEFAIDNIAGSQAIKTIYKFPQQPSGLVYLASWTIPFANFSYVIKVQCHEFGTTGIREAVIMHSLLADKSFNLKTDMHKVSAISDDPKFDTQFPYHPLSRARQYLSQIEPTIILGKDLVNAPPFRV